MTIYKHPKYLHSNRVGLKGVKGTNLFITMLLKILITIAEIIGGLFSGSLSLVSDALHNLSDVLAIVISWFAVKMARKNNDEKNTFGYRRSTIIAAVINSTVLIIISIFLFREAYLKFIEPEKINAQIVIVVALISMIINAVGVYLLQKGSEKDLNMKSVYLHFLSDALSSAVIVAGGVLIYYLNLYWIDPLLTILIGLYIIKESCEILKQAINILMQGTPKGIDINEIADMLEKMDFVKNVHHVHIWALDEETIFFEAHINLNNDILISDIPEVCENLEHELQENFGVTHITIQYEYNCCENAERVIKKG